MSLMKEKKLSVFDLPLVELQIKKAFENNNEIDLLKIVKNNTFLLYELYARKWGIQPPFAEISFGGDLRCDFAWLNDNSDGPEWYLVEIEKPNLQLFTTKNDPTAPLNHAISQLESWERYFEENPSEKNRIFGAVGRFKFILVAGSSVSWNSESAKKWRIHRNKQNRNFEIRSSNIFLKAIETAKHFPNQIWSFNDHPVALNHKDLYGYWQNYSYMDHWRKILK